MEYIEVINTLNPLDFSQNGEPHTKKFAIKKEKHVIKQMTMYFSGENHQNQANPNGSTG